jgi:hypothetical protein
MPWEFFTDEEIAKLCWDMILDPSGEVGRTVEIRDKIAKNAAAGDVDLRQPLIELRRLCHSQGPFASHAAAR